MTDAERLRLHTYFRLLTGVVSAALLVPALTGCGNHPFAGHGSRAFAITHVSVVDTHGGPTQQDMTVIVQGGKIAAIVAAAQAGIPEGMLQVDGHGKFLIPGLNDMHAHLTHDTRFVGPLMIANGVTGVREMFARELPSIQMRRREVATGALHPNILAAGTIVDGEPPSWPNSIVVHNAAEARAAVDRVKGAGYDFVKVYSSLNRESYFAIADESKRAGIPFAGHVTSEVTDWEAANAGQSSIEHLSGVAEACSSKELQLMREAREAALNHNGPAVYLAQRRTLVDSFDESKCQELYRQFVRNQTWQVPTLSIDRVNGGMKDPAIYNPPAIQYVPYLTKTMWSIVRKSYAANITPEDARIYHAAFTEQTQHITGEMRRAGVPIMTGTDAPNPFVVPGFSIHDELGLFVAAGFTPMEALQASTILPAKFLGRLETMGTIEAGKDADLVLLAADPLSDIANTRAIVAVVLNGQLVSGGEIAALKQIVLDHRWIPDGSGLMFLRMILDRAKFVLLGAIVVVGGLVTGTVYLVRRHRRSSAATLPGNA
jgi:imidazolonepropionase-like amidohydrolase